MRTAFLPASLLAAALALPCAAPVHADVLVSIDKSTQRMSVAVDGETRYVWPVSTGRPGYDTPNGTYHPFRMEADHFSKEWDDAPMPHSVFFTKIGHAIHGSLDTKHLGSAASHGCVRLSPDNASRLYALVEAEGLKETTVVIAGQTPIATADAARRRAAPAEAAASEPLDIGPGYGQQDGAYYAQQPPPYDAQPPQSSYYRRPPQPYYAQQPQDYYTQPPPYYGERQPYYARRQYDDEPQPQAYDRQPPPAYRQLPAAAHRGYALPPQPPPPQYFAPRPLLFN
jgi:L,D-transpeptidase-like protein